MNKCMDSKCRIAILAKIWMLYKKNVISYFLSSEIRTVSKMWVFPRLNWLGHSGRKKSQLDLNRKIRILSTSC